jgi:uncharacterized membrane protein
MTSYINYTNQLLIPYLGVAFALVTCAMIVFVKKRSIKFKTALLRLASTAIILLCHLNPTWNQQKKTNSSVAILLDISSSVNSSVAQDSLNKAIRLFPVSKTQIIPFSEKVAPISVPLSPFKQIKDSWQTSLNINTTDLFQAVSETQSRDVDAVLLISDGHTQLPESNSLKLSTPIYPLISDFPVSSTEELFLSALNLPVVAPASSKITIKSTVTNKTSSPVSKDIWFDINGKRACTVKATLKAGEELVVPCQNETPTDGIMKVEASFEGSTGKKIGFVSITTKQKILLLNGSIKDERYLKSALGKIGVEATSEIAGSFTSAPEWAKYSAVILNNVSSQQLGKTYIDSLDTAVRSGLGLITLGGERAYGLGDYHRTKLQDILPVDSIPPQSETKRLSNAIALVIDKSASMEGGSKLLYAKAAAAEVVKRLKDDDYLTVIGFDSREFIIVRIAQVAGIRASAIERINRLYAALSSNLIPGLNAAHKQLDSINAGRKHIIILSDGEVRGTLDYYRQLTTLMKTSGITTSTVYVGFQTPTIMKAIAENGGGKFYETADSSSIPRIFLQDLEVSIGEKTMDEATYPVRTSPQATLISPKLKLPDIRGFVKTKLKPNASLELVTGTLKESPPLLAHFTVEKGKSVALTTDLNGTWSNQILLWPGYSDFLNSLITHVKSSKSKLKPLNFDFRHFITNGALILDLTVFEHLENSSFEIGIRTPSGKNVTIPMNELRSGHYQSSLKTSEAGEYEVAIENADRTSPKLKIFIENPPNIERPSTNYNIENLTRIATLSGGKINPSIQDLRQRTAEKRSHQTDLRPYLLVVFLILLLLETYFRERVRATKI